MKKKITGEDVLAEHLAMIDDEIRRVFRGREFPKPLYDMMRYHLGWLDENFRPMQQYRGKRLRPTICLLAYKSLSGVYDKALPAAAAVELIHNFSLIHDDIEDMDEMRRHRPTVWKLWGIPQAINVGDGMHVLANLAALRLREINVSSDKIVRVMQILNNTVIELCEGQYLDMSFQERLDVTPEMYMQMISKKTAALIEASSLCGAVLATNDDTTIQHFKKFGRSIGTAFQIVDDIIGVWGRGEHTGKPKASDIRNKKKTLPVLYAFAEASQQDKKTLLSIYKKEKLSESDVGRVLAILEKLGAKEHAIKVARNYEKEAMTELERIKMQAESQAKIKILAQFLVSRTY